MFKAVCKLGLEGIVSKKLDSPYKSGPSKAWLKIKNPKAPADTRHRWNVLGKKDLAVMPSKEEDRAERLFRQRQEGTKALQEYRAKQEATRNLTAKLRAERLAREAIHGQPKPNRKRTARS
jgi:hypothetical protein